MADKSISELPTINAVTGDEYLYGIQSDGDVKIVADDLVDYILNTYEFNSDVTNANVIAGKINSLRTLTNTADLADKTYPPGSLYWSSSSTSPASILGGVWTRVKDRCQRQVRFSGREQLYSRNQWWRISPSSYSLRIPIS